MSANETLQRIPTEEVLAFPSMFPSSN